MREEFGYKDDPVSMKELFNGQFWEGLFLKKSDRIKLILWNT